MAIGGNGAVGSARPDLDPDEVLTKAFVRSAELLGVPQKDQAQLLGVSPASVSRYRKNRFIPAQSKEGELALIFLRLYRSLSTHSSEASGRLAASGSTRTTITSKRFRPRSF